MTELDDLPQMVSLSPEPATSLDEGSRYAKKITANHTEFKRHNWDAQAIEVLWKQDCDLGLTRRDFAPVRSSSEEEPDDVVPEKLARLGEEWCQEGCKLEGPAAETADDPLEDIWSGLDYTIDSETGEYVLRMPQPASVAAVPVAAVAATAVPSSVESLNSGVGALLTAPIPTTIDELVTVDRQTTLMVQTEQPESRTRRPTHSSDSGRESLCDSDSGDAELTTLSQVMGATPTPAAALQRPFQRLVSMEERWQDLASILLLSEQAGAQALPADQPTRPLSAEQTAQGHCPADTALVPATVAPGATPALGAQARLPSPGDTETQYFQLAPLVSPPSPPALDQDAAFLSQLLGVDDLDMTDDPLEPQGWANSANSGGTRSPVEHVSSPISQLHQLGPLSASSSTSSSSSPSSAGAADGAPSHRPPPAQKKHHMYGKRIFNGQQQDDYNSASPGGSNSSRSSGSDPTPSPSGERYGSEAGARGLYPGAHVPAPVEAAAVASPVEFKYSGTAEFAAAQPQSASPVAHNHSYHQPSPAEGRTEPRPPLARDKESRKGDRLTRDERRTREMNIPLTPEEIVHLPMDEFNERLSKLQLSEAQLSLVRDVRRRGKNKLAAQNCRKRKLDQIQSLTEDLEKVRDQRRHHLADHQALLQERARIKDKYAQLHRHVFQSLRDERGHPYSAAQYSLQLSADGVVLLVPRGAARGAAFVPPDPSSGARQKQ